MASHTHDKQRFFMGCFMSAGDPFTNQHTVSQTYLRSWAQSRVSGRIAECWTFSLTDERSYGPAVSERIDRLLTEDNIYTLTMPDGTRNLKYERGTFYNLEQKFGRLKEHFDKPAFLLNNSRKTQLASFAAYQVLKVPAMLDQYHGQMRGLIDGIDRHGDPALEDIIIETTGKNGQKTPHTVSEIRKLLSNKFENFIIPRLEKLAVIVRKMELDLIEFDDPNSLITSDTPAIINVPHAGAYFSNIGDKESKIFFPLSPRLLAIFNWNKSAVKSGTEADSVRANVLQIRNARKKLIGPSDTISPQLFEEAKYAPEASAFIGARGHMDPVSAEVERNTPMFFETWGPNVPKQLHAINPDGSINPVKAKKF